MKGPLTPKIIFTKNGKEIPNQPPNPVPPNANDVHGEFDPITGEIKRVWWTENGEILQNLPPIQVPLGANDVIFSTGDDGDSIDIFPPPGANDFHIKWEGSRIVDFYFTKDGVPIPPEPLPTISSMHLIFFSKC